VVAAGMGNFGTLPEKNRRSSYGGAGRLIRRSAAGDNSLHRKVVGPAGGARHLRPRSRVFRSKSTRIRRRYGS
jgi:hypothetical protein